MVVNHITAKEFMAAVKIGRTKFDKLVNMSRIKVIKKKRKIYVPVSEVNRYFIDPNINDYNKKIIDMSDHVQLDGSTRIGTIGGTLLVTLLNIFHNDFIRTIGFAAVGATVSFFVSLFWKWAVGRMERRKTSKTKNPAT